jgi:hypothetical protein
MIFPQAIRVDHGILHLAKQVGTHHSCMALVSPRQRIAHSSTQDSRRPDYKFYQYCNLVSDPRLMRWAPLYSQTISHSVCVRRSCQEQPTAEPRTSLRGRH